MQVDCIVWRGHCESKLHQTGQAGHLTKQGRKRNLNPGPRNEPKISKEHSLQKIHQQHAAGVSKSHQAPFYESSFFPNKGFWLGRHEVGRTPGACAGLFAQFLKKIYLYIYICLGRDRRDSGVAPHDDHSESDSEPTHTHTRFGIVVDHDATLRVVPPHMMNRQRRWAVSILVAGGRFFYAVNVKSTKLSESYYAPPPKTRTRRIQCEAPL